MGGCQSCKEPNLVRSDRYYDVRVERPNIKLEFTLENIELNNDYQIIVNFPNDQNPFYTEKITSSMQSITFNKCYMGNYYFEKEQNLKVTVIKNGSNDSILQVTIGNIVGSPGSIYKSVINGNANIIISAQGLSDYKATLIVKLKAKSDNYYNFIEKKNKISYVVSSEGKIIYHSESINNNGKFNEEEIPANLLENGFDLTFLDAFQEPISVKPDNIKHFSTREKTEYALLKVNNECLKIINKSYINPNITFIDYIRAGVQIKLSIAIDYTSDYTSTKIDKSLHYLSSGMNDYEQAINACGMKVAYYDYNQNFPVYGFGALLNGESQINPCFNINFKKDPEIKGINNVLLEYRNSFKSLQICRPPTKFNKLIQKVVNLIKKEQNHLKYHILLIITAGQIDDLRETIDILVEGSFQPLSVIIIGIGNGDFTNMVILDGDDDPLVNSTGVIRDRDLVQFVPFNKFRNDSNKLSEEVLEEVPRQIIEYYTKKNLTPENIKMATLGINNKTMNTASNSFPTVYNQLNSQYVNLNIHKNKK